MIMSCLYNIFVLHISVHVSRRWCDRDLHPSASDSDSADAYRKYFGDEVGFVHSDILSSTTLISLRSSVIDEVVSNDVMVLM